MRFVPTRAFGAVVIAAFAVVVLTGATAFAGSNGAGGGGLSKHDRELLAQAKASGKDSVVLIIASKGGANRDVVRSIEAQGGSILNRDDSLGYVLARVATDKVQAIAALDSIQGIDLDEIIPFEDPRPEGAVNPTPQTPPSAATPRVNPYMPTGDTGAAQFAPAHPTWDGRGVTIGIVDLGVSLDHPSLHDDEHRRAQDRRLGHGHAIRPTTATRPGSTCRTRSAARRFTFGGVTYTAPANGTLPHRPLQRARPAPRRRGRQRRQPRRQPGRLQRHLRRPLGHGDEQGLGRHEPEQLVRRRGGDDRLQGQLRRRATSAPTTPRPPSPSGCRSSSRPTARTSSSTSASSRASTARTWPGIAAGNSLFGGAMSGAAPGAKIVSVRACLFIAGCTAHALLEGMIYAAKQSQRRRDQHVDRRPAGAQRRQQRPLRRLRPLDRAVRTCRCSSRPATAARA